MISVKVGGSPEEVLQGSRHRLFVEGRENALDVKALEALLFGLPINIKAMGPSFHVKSVAEALHPHHPDYYFLVDRDHHDHETVERSWSNFPDSSTSNLLIWRKREIENYFLDPVYLQQSEFIREKFTGEEGQRLLEQEILRIANQRLFLDVANSVIIWVRECQKQNWIKTFTDPGLFTDAQSARDWLVNRNEFQERRSSVSSSVEPAIIEERFDQFLNEFSGGQIPLVFGCGQWCERMSGKELLRQIVNTCFTVHDANDKLLQGDKKYIEVLKNLMKQDLASQPADFHALFDLIEKRISNS